jgi:hypothetical protein
MCLARPFSELRFLTMSSNSYLKCPAMDNLGAEQEAWSCRCKTPQIHSKQAPSSTHSSPSCMCCLLSAAAQAPWRIEASSSCEVKPRNCNMEFCCSGLRLTSNNSIQGRLDPGNSLQSFSNRWEA